MPVDIEKLFDSLRLGAKPCRGRLAPSKPESETDIAKLHDRLNNFRGVGWVCFTERLWLREAGATLPTNLGPVLSAEFYLAHEDTSLHVRQKGPGWVVRAIAKTDGADGSAWVIAQEFLRHDWGAVNGGVRVSYEVCWEPDGDAVLRPTVSRFVGFAPREVE